MDQNHCSNVSGIGVRIRARISVRISRNTHLAGEVEVKASGGETRVFKAGDILLARDTHGHGHITVTRSQGRSVIVAI